MWQPHDEDPVRYPKKYEDHEIQELLDDLAVDEVLTKQA